MTEQRDDDALSWAGDDDPTLAPSGSADGVVRAGEAAEEVPLEVPTEPSPESALPPVVVTTVAPTNDDAGVEATKGFDAVTTEQPVAREQMSSTMLVTLGIFGGVFLLYSVGWLISAFRPDAAVPSDTVGEFMFNVGQGLAVAAGPVWMAATLWLTRDSKPYVRIAMLALGVVLVLPWPFLRGV